MDFEIGPVQAIRIFCVQIQRLEFKEDKHPALKIQGFCVCLFFRLWNFLHLLEENKKMRGKQEANWLLKPHSLLAAGDTVGPYPPCVHDWGLKPLYALASACPSSRLVSLSNWKKKKKKPYHVPKSFMFCGS